MATDVLGMGSTFFLVALDAPTYNAACAAGLAVVPSPASRDEQLQGMVQYAKFLVSKWLVDHAIDFLFFEVGELVSER